MIRRMPRERDQGAVLVMVLIVVVVVSMVVGALLSLADTSIRTTTALGSQGTTSYEAQGAAQAAINNIRNSTYSGASGQTCFGAANSLTVKYPTDAAVVTCATDPAKVSIQCPSPSNCNRPGDAILSLGKVNGEAGINISQPNTSTFKVHGNIFSNSTINTAGTLSTNAATWARGSCFGRIQSGLGTNCNYGSTNNPLGNDPGYTPYVGIGSLPYRSAASIESSQCTGHNKIISFLPGYYDDAATLTDMMNGHGNNPCRGSVWWFTPGVYYFDFHNGGTNANPLLDGNGGDNDNDGDSSGNSNVWTVDDGHLVAGTPTDASGKTLATPPLNPHMPGSCDSPLTDPAAKGVQFIFGGSSQFQVGSGQVELCGTWAYGSTRPPVAIYGMASGSETTTSLTGSSTLALTKVDSAGGFGASATVANLSASDNTKYSTWKSIGNGHNFSTTLGVSGFAPQSAIPAGSILQSATLRVTHRHSDRNTHDALAATLTPSGTSQNVSGTDPGNNGSSSFAIDQIALDTARTGALATAIHNGTFTGASVALTVTLSNSNDTEDIDAITLDLSYTAPAFRGASDCLTETPYNGGDHGSCAQISTDNGSGSTFYVQGTTYVPASVVDLTLNNLAAQAFQFGVIARAVWVKQTGSFGYTGPVISVPDDSAGFALSMYLTAYLCPNTSSCTPGGTPQVRVRVGFQDADPSNPVPGKRKVAILSWSGPG